MSRGTIRETIKILAAQRLVESTRGAKGRRAPPEPKEVAEAMADSITLWFNAGSTSLAQVNDARACIEHGCVVMASQDRDDEDLDRSAGRWRRWRPRAWTSTTCSPFDIEFTTPSAGPRTTP